MRLEDKRTAELLTNFGKAVRNKREGFALSQEDLAEAANFDRTYISLLERGKRNPSLSNLCRLAAALTTTPSNLLTGITYGT